MCACISNFFVCVFSLHISILSNIAYIYVVFLIPLLFPIILWNYQYKHFLVILLSWITLSTVQLDVQNITQKPLAFSSRLSIAVFFASDFDQI